MKILAKIVIDAVIFLIMLLSMKKDTDISTYMEIAEYIILGALGCIFLYCSMFFISSYSNNYEIINHILYGLGMVVSIFLFEGLKDKWEK